MLCGVVLCCFEVLFCFVLWCCVVWCVCCGVELSSEEERDVGEEGER